MLSLQSTQLVHARVILGIGPLWRVQHVIQILVVTKLLAQRIDALFRRRIGGGGFVGHRKDYRKLRVG